MSGQKCRRRFLCHSRNTENLINSMRFNLKVVDSTLQFFEVDSTCFFMTIIQNYHQSLYSFWGFLTCKVLITLTK